MLQHEDKERLAMLRQEMIYFETQEDDVYNERWIEETDELNPWDQGFMLGYLGA